MGYFSTWTERTEAGMRLVPPYALMAVLFIFSIVSFSFPVAGSIKAPLMIMVIYYWSIYRPTLIPVWLVFAVGLLTDLVGNIPLGLSALVFVAVQWVVTDQRRYLMGQSFLMIWIGYMIVSLSAKLIEWAVFGLFSEGWPPLQPVFFSVLMGIALFPLISMLLHFTHKILPEPRGISIKSKRR